MESSSTGNPEMVLDYRPAPGVRPPFARAKALGLAIVLLLPALSLLRRDPWDAETIAVSAGSRTELTKRQSCTIVRYDTIYPPPGSSERPQIVPVCAEDSNPPPSLSKRQKCTVVRYDTIYPPPGSSDPPQTVPVCAEDLSTTQSLSKRQKCTVVRYDTIFPAPGSSDPPQTVPICAEDLTPTPSHPRVRRLFDIVETDEDAKPTLLHAVHPLHSRDASNATTKSCTVVRYDGYFPYPGAELEYWPVCMEDLSSGSPKLKRFQMRSIEDSRNQIWTPPAHRLNARALAEPFAINLTCNPTGTLTQATCNKALTGFRNAGKRIARALQITTQIVVQAEFVSFCNDASTATTCGTVDGVTTLGQAGPAANIPVSMGDSQLNVPQALFKNANLEQNTGNTITLNSFDIIAQFNADYNFWFNDNTTTIAATQVDFEFIVMHEFIHGCGFASGWSTWFTSLVGKQSFLTPNYYTYRTTTTTTWGGWNPANVFDKYIVENSTQRYLMSAYSTLTNYTGSRSQTVAQFVSSFQASGASFQEATRVFNVVTSGQFALYFQPNPMVSNESVWLQTYAGSFEQGSSIGHTNEIYSKTSDFLMGAAITGGNLYGQTLDQIVAAQGGYRYGAMGPRLVSIMASIGWPVVDGALPNSSLTGTTLTGGSTSSSGANSSANGLNSGTFLGPLTLLQFIGVVVGLFALALMTLSLYAYLRKKSKRRQRSQMRSMPETRTTNHFHGVAPAEPRNGLLSGRPPPPPPPNYPPPPPAMATHTSHSGSSPHAATARVVRPSFAPSHPNGRPPNGAYITPQTSQEEEEQLALALALSVSDGR